MFPSSLIFVALILLCHGVAQTTTYFEPGVPTDVAIPGDYTGQYRPQVHYSPPTNFMNDPNGMHRDPNGLWHMYYQYNPSEPVAGDQHWGHATSRDLYHWENQKIALWPFNKTTYVYSGSAVIDTDNTSGFFPNQDNGVVALYTIAAAGGFQTQNLAYSRDGGYTFETYAKNPIINIDSTQFRDPQVTRYGSHWVMATARSSEFKIEFWTSTNLREWTAVSNFSHHGLLGLQYECPNLVKMPVDGSSEDMYLLYISINPGAPLGGSVGQYFPGTFDGTHFKAIDGAARIADFGKDNYATQFFYGVPNGEPAVSMAWASNWQYTSLVPTGPSEGWRSQMSLPRYNYLKKIPKIGGYIMVSEPYNLNAIFSRELAHRGDIANSSLLVDYSTVKSGALYLELNVTGLTDDTLAGNVNFTMSSGAHPQQYVTGGTFVGGDTWMDRGHATGFENNYFTDKFSATGVYGGEGIWRISVVIDRSIIEIFVNGGEQSATNTFYATHPLDTLRIASAGINANAKVSVGVWALEDAWAMQANANGTVVGNTTSSF